jgi:hypothetical protein
MSFERADRHVNQSRSFLMARRLNRIVFALAPLLASILYPVVGHSQQTFPTLLQLQSKIQAADNRDRPCRIVYLGVVGGTETPNNSRSGVVQIRDILRGPAFPNVCAKSFSPYAWKSSLHWILGYFPSHPGPLTGDELEKAPKVILVGHSLGGWAVLSVARNLEHKGISVELCIQIDSVGITDHTAPGNVKAAAIFHANDALFFLTTKKIKLADPSQTNLVENILVKDAGHLSVTRDPRVKDLVLCTVQALGEAPTQKPNCPFPSDLKTGVAGSGK